MSKKRTSINIDESLYDAVIDSGVRNFSTYIEGLLKVDLKSLAQADLESGRRIKKLNARLDVFEERWFKMQEERAKQEAVQ